MDRPRRPAPRLILIRHAAPRVDPQQPAHLWPLSVQGRRAARRLVNLVRGYAPDRVVTSAERKAYETGAIVARALGLPVGVAAGLEEHDRRGVPWMARPQFEALVARFFARPGDLVFGRESADQAHQRFRQALDRVLASHPRETWSVVTHGTVMALFVCRAAGLEPFPWWQQLGVPAMAVLSWPDLRILNVVESVG